MSADTVPQMDSVDASMIKLDDSIFIDFRRREEKLDRLEMLPNSLEMLLPFDSFVRFFISSSTSTLKLF